MTSKQLAAARLSSASISDRVRSGRLHRLHRGVYSLSPPPVSQAARWMAAVLASGPGAALSHTSAAFLWELLKPIDGPIEVSVPTQNGRRSREGIVVHRRAALDRGLTVRNLIPVTAPWLTIEDLRGIVSPKHYRRAVREAQARRYALGPRTRGDRTRSDPEGDFLTLVRRYRFTAPEVNVRLGRWIVDFLWRAERVVVEVDTWRYHGGSIAFQDDHERDVDLRRRGFQILRYTDVQIREQAALIAADLAAALRPSPARAPAVAPAQPAASARRPRS